MQKQSEIKIIDKIMIYVILLSCEFDDREKFELLLNRILCLFLFL